MRPGAHGIRCIRRGVIAKMLRRMLVMAGATAMAALRLGSLDGRAVEPSIDRILLGGPVHGERCPAGDERLAEDIPASILNCLIAGKLLLSNTRKHERIRFLDSWLHERTHTHLMQFYTADSCRNRLW